MTSLPGVALLFCPADRPERFAKAASVADCVILDLEDGIASDSAAMARDAICTSSLDPDRVIVRVHPATHPSHEADVGAVRRTPFRRLMLAKTETVDDLAGLTDFEIVALCETARGVMNAAAIAAVPHVSALMWGAEDLTASVGGTSSRGSDGGYHDLARFARAWCLMAAATVDKPCIDAVWLDLADTDGLRKEVKDGTAMGFAAKACIHPTQLPIVRAAFTPNAEQLAWATEVLAAAGGNVGAFNHGGKMIDAPLLAQAAKLLARAAGQTSSGGTG